jgi:hypothetical protein
MEVDNDTWMYSTKKGLKAVVMAILWRPLRTLQKQQLKDGNFFRISGLSKRQNENCRI